jgi:4-amino-4-deoxy-L-arabinose transferase-like glycosyltransferase
MLRPGRCFGRRRLPIEILSRTPYNGEMTPGQSAVGAFRSMHRGIILLAVLLLPVFFINVKGSHSWNGDFALYILQAKNLVESKPQTATGYIFNEQCVLPSPQTYPVGFPILLAPFYCFFGNNILVFSCFISLILVLLGLILYCFFCGHFSPLVSGCAALLIVYNPWTLSFKGEILADFPFTLFLMLAVIAYTKLDLERRAFQESMRLGILVAITMLLKSVGVALLVAILADFILLMAKKLLAGEKRNANTGAVNLLVAAGSALLLYAAVAFLLLPSAREPLPYYRSLYNFREPLALLAGILRNYVGELQDFFYLKGYGANILALATIVLVSVLLAVGFIKKCLKGSGMIEWLTAVYAFVALAFPTANQGLRYLFPILPLFIYYTVLGARSLPRAGKIQANHVLVAITLLCLLHYPIGIMHVLREQGKTVAGPQEKQSQEAFRFIRENTARDAVIAFRKSTVLPLYADRKCIGANRMDQDVASLAAKFSQVGVRYYLTNSDLNDHALERFIFAYKASLRLVWSNDKFKLYQKIN